MRNDDRHSRKPAHDWNELSCTVPIAPSGEGILNRGDQRDSPLDSYALYRVVSHTAVTGTRRVETPGRNRASAVASGAGESDGCSAGVQASNRRAALPNCDVSQKPVSPLECPLEHVRGFWDSHRL